MSHLARRRVDSGARTDAVPTGCVFTVNPLFFETTGCLLDSTGLTMSQIDKLSTKRPTSTYITFAEWRTFARDVVGLPEKTITSLFDAFHTLSCKQENRVESSRLLLGKMGGTLEDSRYRTAAATRVVGLPGFSLFLMVQTYLESSKGDRVADNTADILAFVKNNLTSFLTAVGITRPGHVTHKDVADLGFILREFDKNVEHSLGTNLGFLWKDERILDIPTVASYIRSRTVSPSEIKDIVGNITVTGSNSAMQILHSPLGPQPIRLPGYTFRIQSASQTNFYVTSVLPSTTLTGLSNCVVQLGPVSGVLRVFGCENCAISAICGSIIVSDCKNVTLFICSNTPPILAESQGKLEGVAFAPYNTHYASLEEHIASSGLNPKLNLWRIGLPESLLLPPSKFVASSFPVAPTSVPMMVTRTNPCPLPKEYQDALNQKMQSFAQTSSMLQSAYKQLEAAGRRDLADSLRNKVHTMFLDWAYNKGQVKSLVDLLQNNTQVAPE